MNFSILLNTKEDILMNADHFAMVLYSTVVNYLKKMKNVKIKANSILINAS